MILFEERELFSLCYDFTSEPTIVHPSSLGSNVSKESKNRRIISILRCAESDWTFSAKIAAGELAEVHGVRGIP